MVRNTERRTVLVDAAVEVLARLGARGLTFRAVDAQACVPTGTASNYFNDRDDLLNQVGDHIFVRLAPDPEKTAELMSDRPSRELDVVLMRDLVARATADQAGYLAMLELRLEATRRPELRTAFTERVRTNIDDIVRLHVGSGFPGDRMTVIVLYLAMWGLVVEHLTLPDVLPVDSPDELVANIVRTIVPPTPD